MAAAPRGVEAHSLLGGSYPLMTDAVEKVGATLTTRNNRIAQAGFLNRSCAFDARLESILLEDPLKIFFRQYRPEADVHKQRRTQRLPQRRRREAWTPRARASPLLCGPSLDVAGCVPNNFVHAPRLGKHRHMT